MNTAVTDSSDDRRSTTTIVPELDRRRPVTGARNRDTFVLSHTMRLSNAVMITLTHRTQRIFLITVAEGDEGLAVPIWMLGYLPPPILLTHRVTSIFEMQAAKPVHVSVRLLNDLLRD